MKKKATISNALVGLSGWSWTLWVGVLWVAVMAGCFPPPLEQSDDEGETANLDSEVDEVDTASLDDTLDTTAETLDTQTEGDTADTDTSDTTTEETVDTTVGPDSADTDTSGDTDTSADTNTSSDTDTEQRNICGGLGILSPGEPGSPCGPCQDGELICDLADPLKNTTRCAGPSALNACQGCGPVTPALGSGCGTCGQIVCDGAGGTRCAEPAAGCLVPLTCEDLACGEERRECLEGVGDADAVCGGCQSTYVDVGGQCLGQVVAVQGVTATTDLEDRILVSWGAVVHATGYRLYRCAGTCGPGDTWVELLPVAIAQTSFPDLTAAPPASPAAPTVSATVNRSDAVQVSWPAVVAPAAPRYSFRVVAVGPTGESPPSNPAVGHIAERPTTGYELSVAGGTWQAVDTTSFLDAEAAPPTLGAGAVSASQGTFADKVVLTLASWSSPDGASREYRVRAKTRFGVGANGTATGRRAAGALTLSWERSQGTAPADFVPIAGAGGPVQTARTFEDTDSQGIPPNGVVRYYRARLSAPGAAEILSEPAAGWRLPAPGVPQIQSVTTELQDRVEVRWTPVDGALGYHIYRQGNRITPTQGVVCASSPCVFADLDAPAAGTWVAPSSVSATTNQTGGVTVSWSLPGRPKGTRQLYEVSAINPAGESARSPQVDGWRSAPALTGLEVKATVSGADTTHFVAADATSYNHTAAPLATFVATTLTATQGDHRNHARLTLTGGTLNQAATVSYQVRGQFSGGTSPWSSASTGRRTTGTITRAWEYANPLNPTVFAAVSTVVCPTTGTSCNDTTASAIGTKRIYRTTLSAPGATSLTTNTMEGWRLAFTYVDGGSEAMCAIDTNGRLWAWGQLNGQGSSIPRIRAPGPFVTCTSGGSVLSYDGVGFGCARTSLGDVFCGSLLADNPLIQRVDLGTGVKSIEVREAHGCAVKSNGQAVCWGWGFAGQLGNNMTSDSPTSPVTVVRSTGAALTGLEEVDVGSVHSCARTSGGAVWCWGENSNGQLGNGTDLMAKFAVQVPSITGSLEIKLGSQHTCLRLGSGELRCFGRNQLGQLGDGTTDDRLSPVPVLSSLSPATALSGALHLAALDVITCSRRSNDLLCWGESLSLSHTHTTLPQVTQLVGSASQIGAGRWTICAIVNGGLWCWGSNRNATIGDGTLVDKPSPTLVSLP